MKIRYLETGSQDPFYNLAFEEYVLKNRRDGAYLLLWQNDNTIVVGQNQNTEEEINRAFVEAKGIRVVRRATGGGAVYHDLGNLNYSFITDMDSGTRVTMERFTQPVAQALRRLGLCAEVSGRNDIQINGQKVSGAAQRKMHGRILHHGTLLFDSQLDVVAQALKVDPEKFRSKSTKSVRSRVGNIRSFLQKDMDLPAFWTYLKGALAEDGLEEDSLQPQELEAVEELRATKYSTWEWNYGRSPAYELVNRRRFAGGGLEVGIQVKEGCIARIGFYGDFLSVVPTESLATALQGCAFRKETVTAILDQFTLSDFFGGITCEEVLETIFSDSSGCETSSDS